jgi:hypothetical protein
MSTSHIQYSLKQAGDYIMKTSKSNVIAKQFKDACKEHGWNYIIRNEIVSITKDIEGIDDLVKADSEYWEILAIIPTTRSGSTWGTDGGGVGAMSALKNNLFVMTKSGCSKQVLNKLRMGV